jgi:hypothetical protein
MSKTQKGQAEGDMPVRRGQPKKNASGPRHVLSSEFINVGQIPKGKDSRITLPPISSIRVSELRPGPSGEPVRLIREKQTSRALIFLVFWSILFGPSTSRIFALQEPASRCDFWMHVLTEICAFIII